MRRRNNTYEAIIATYRLYEYLYSPEICIGSMKNLTKVKLKP